MTCPPESAEKPINQSLQLQIEDSYLYLEAALWTLWDVLIPYPANSIKLLDHKPPAQESRAKIAAMQSRLAKVSSRPSPGVALAVPGS